MIALTLIPASGLHLSIWQVLFAIAWLLVVGRLMAAQTDDLDAIAAQAVIRCLDKAELSRKEAASVMGLNEAQLNRQLRAEPMNHLSIARLLRLATIPAGVVFWAHFGPTLFYLVAERRGQEISDVFRTRI